MNIEELGKTIQTARLNKGISQAELSAAVRIARPTLSKLENGKLPELGMSKVMQICDQLGMEITVVIAHKRPTLNTLVEENLRGVSLGQTTTRRRVRRHSPNASDKDGVRT